jgi:hypothetical protein
MINYIQTLKVGLMILIVSIAIWFYKDWQFQKLENIRQTENVRQIRISDSLRFSSQIVNSNELKDYLQYQNSNLLNNLKKEGIKENRIKEIVSTNYFYRDTTYREFKGSKFIDSTKCLTIKGTINENGSVSITDRNFHNKTDAVAYWERKQWSFLGIKSRFFGKKQMTAKVFNECGESQIINIKKKEN